mmetsp:Transcript_19996/g.50608  ORF Transcript_19996/g.50608 Transcript_19996/m.50608 type:complete len:214 (-) Transcript_19996:527-1168(-)
MQIFHQPLQRLLALSAPEKLRAHQRPGAKLHGRTRGRVLRGVSQRPPDVAHADEGGATHWDEFHRFVQALAVEVAARARARQPGAARDKLLFFQEVFRLVSELGLAYVLPVLFGLLCLSNILFVVVVRASFTFRGSIEVRVSVFVIVGVKFFVLVHTAPLAGFGLEQPPLSLIKQEWPEQRPGGGQQSSHDMETERAKDLNCEPTQRSAQPKA